MTSFRIRPRFKYLSPLSQEEIKQKIRHQLKNTDRCFAIFLSNQIKLKINSKEEHYWSPQLHLTLEAPEEGNGTIIRGLYGPNPRVWTVFVFVYALLSTVLLFVSIFAFSKISLGQKTPIVWAIPIICLLIFATYIASQIGQKIGAEQTYTLHHFFEACIENKVSIS